MLAAIHRPNWGETGNKKSNRATILDTLTGEQRELPGLIQARRYHSSIALDKHNYAIGGHAEGIRDTPWIEFLDHESKQAW